MRESRNRIEDLIPEQQKQQDRLIRIGVRHHHSILISSNAKITSKNKSFPFLMHNKG
jgi:hypothetical protein